MGRNLEVSYRVIMHKVAVYIFQNLSLQNGKDSDSMIWKLYSTNYISVVWKLAIQVSGNASA
jgi:hypothetical protein